jgi:ankyrin repeat protein
MIKVGCLLVSCCTVDTAYAQAWFNQIATEQEVLDDLKSKKFDVNARNDEGLTGLMLAAKNGKLGVAQLLLDYGAYVDARADARGDQSLDAKVYENDGNTALQLACLFGNNNQAEALIDLLLAKGAQVNVRNNTGDSPIHLIMFIAQDLEKRMRILKKLVAHGAKLDAQNNRGHTLLHLTAAANDRSWASMMKDNFGSVINFSIKNNDGFTPKELALSLGQGDMAETLTQLAVPLGTDNVRERDNQERTGLMLAIARNDPNFVLNQLKHLAEVNAQDVNGNTPLHYAVMRQTGALDFVKQLLDYVANVNMQNNKGNTPLHTVAQNAASSNDRNAQAQLLVDHGARLLQNNEGDTPLHLAVRRSDAQLVTLFKDLPHADDQNKKGKTPLAEARDMGYDKIVKILEKQS